MSFTAFVAAEAIITFPEKGRKIQVHLTEVGVQYLNRQIVCNYCGQILSLTEDTSHEAYEAVEEALQKLVSCKG